MKKRILLLTVATIMVFGLSGCSDKINTISDVSTEASTKTTTETNTETNTETTTGQTTTDNLLNNVYASMDKYSYTNITESWKSIDGYSDLTSTIDSKNKYNFTNFNISITNYNYQFIFDYSNDLLYSRCNSDNWKNEGDINSVLTEYSNEFTPFCSSSSSFFKQLLAISNGKIKDEDFVYDNGYFTYAKSYTKDQYKVEYNIIIDGNTLLPTTYFLKTSSGGDESTSVEVKFTEFSNEKVLELPSDLPVTN